MIFATHSEYLENRVFEIIEDLKTEARITGESIRLIESASDDKFDVVHSLHEMGYIAKLRRFYDKWNAGEDAVYYLRRLLSYVLSKNPDCKKDVRKSFMKDVTLHNEEIESILPYSAGLTAKQYRIMRNALSVLSAGTYQDDLIQSFLLHFKKIYFQPMKNLYYWEKVMATNVLLSFESLVCVVYYSLTNIEKIRSIQNVYKSLDFNNLKYFLFLLRVKQYLRVFDELIEDGVLEFAQREIEEGTYEKNASNRSINYADRLALETKTTPVLIRGEHLVNDYMLDLSVNSTEDEETVRELMRRLTIISIEYRLLTEKYERTIDWTDSRDPNGKQYEVEAEDILDLYTDGVSS